MIEINDRPIDTGQLVRQVSAPAAGAVVLFLGTAREVTGGRRTESLDYEAYGEMAREKLQGLEEEARRRWPIVGCGIVHRVGHLEIGAVSVAVAVRVSPAVSVSRFVATPMTAARSPAGMSATVAKSMSLGSVKQAQG